MNKKEPQANVHKNYSHHANDLFEKAQKYWNTSNDTLLMFGNELELLGELHKDEEVIVKGKLLQANYQWRTGNYLYGMKVAMEALEMAEKSNYQQKIPHLYRIIGNLHKENENYPLALRAAQQGIEVAKALGDSANIIMLMLNRAMFTHSYGMLKNDDSLRYQGLLYHLEGLELAESDSKYEQLRIPYYNNICQYYKISGEFSKGLFYGFRAKRLAEKYNQHRSLTYAYNWLGEIYFTHGEHKKGIEFLNKALQLTIDLNTPYREAEINKALYKCYAEAGDNTLALKHFSRAVALTDSLQVLTNVQQIGELQIKYETEKKEQRIEALRLINSEKSHRAKIIFIALIILVLLLVFLFAQYFAIKRRNRLLAQTNEKIQQQSEQLQYLMKELHHRVKNNLQIVSSLLTLQSSHMSHMDAKQAIQTGQQRIEAMSLIHRSLYRAENPNLINMKEYVAQLVESIMQSFGVDKEGMDVSLNIEIESMDVDTALPLGLIINEWLTNAFKYAYKDVHQPLLKLSLKPVHGILLEIEDNGPGMSAEVWEKPNRSFGLKLIQVLGKQLKGNCRMVSTGGAKLILQIP